MFFTREDINKIYQALLKLGIKDSELPRTSDVKNDDTLAIVQDGENKQINVREFLNQISLWKREDFINVTDKYKKSHITLVEAIQAIPIVQRKEGLVITFLDNENNWRIYQFRGSLLQFNNETLWVDLYDFSPYIIDSILPDEEDITQSAINEQGNTYLSLKDREYNPSEFSSKGYKILRKNITEVETPTGRVKKNILTSAMIDKPNTIYEIRYDFDLNGAEISIPENSELMFNGGTISNGDYKYISIEHSIVKASKVGFKEGSSSAIAKRNGMLLGTLLANGIGIDFENKEYSIFINKTVVCNYLKLSNGILNIDTNILSIFDVKDNVNNSYICLDNIIFNNASDQGSSIWLYRIARNLDLYYNYITVNNCTFENISLYWAEFADFNPSVHKCGVTNFSFRNSRIYNSTSTFCLLDNCFYESCTIQNNYIRNNAYTVFYFGNNSDFVNFNTKNLGNLLFENNVHINDENFLSASNSDYICTLLTEGQYVIIRNNIFENIRAFNSTVYAFYGSANVLECSDNIIKNVFNINECTYPIIPLTENNSYNEIFKSKGGEYGINPNYNIRKFHNNIVRIERANYIKAMKICKEFPDDYAYYDKVQLRTKLYAPAQPVSIEFTNNDIDIEGLLITNRSGGDIINANFSNNEITFYNVVALDYTQGIEDKEDREGTLLFTVCNDYSGDVIIKNNIFRSNNTKVISTLNLCNISYRGTENTLLKGGMITITDNTACNLSLNAISDYDPTVNYNFNNNYYVCNNIDISSTPRNIFASVMYAPTVGEVVINEPVCCTLITNSKNVDLYYSMKGIKPGLELFSRYVQIPLLEENESILVEYTDIYNNIKRYEIYKDNSTFYVGSDTNSVNTTLDTTYYDYGDTGGISIRYEKDINALQVFFFIGKETVNEMYSIRIKYFPYRLNLKQKKGTSASRPTLKSSDIGYQYYDTTLKKFVVWNGTEWTNMDGTTL